MNQSALTSAGQWTVDLMSGQLAMAVAILGVAAVGFAMLEGQIRWRRGFEVVLGVFVIFGASNLANGILVLRSPEMNEPREAIALPVVSVRPPASAIYDPYAGASVPTSRAPSDLVTP